MAKKKTAPMYAICGQCGEDIDMPKLQAAMKADQTYVHYCGRVLFWGGNESEVLPNHLADNQPWDTSESQSTGDA